MEHERRHTDREIMAELTGLREIFEERTGNIFVTLKRIEEQTIRTNGRVTTLELMDAENKGKVRVAGALWGTVSSMIVAGLTYVFFKT